MPTRPLKRLRNIWTLPKRITVSIVIRKLYYGPSSHLINNHKHSRIALDYFALILGRPVVRSFTQSLVFRNLIFSYFFSPWISTSLFNCFCVKTLKVIMSTEFDTLRNFSENFFKFHFSNLDFHVKFFFPMKLFLSRIDSMSAPWTIP